MGPSAHILPDGKRLHLQHGPIDLVIGADGARNRAFEAAVDRFSTVLSELVEELPALRREMTVDTPRPAGAVARRMHGAALLGMSDGFLTRMAAVAGSVADEVLQAMRGVDDLERAYVNNGGDIALHLAQGAEFTTAIQNQLGDGLGQITLRAADEIGGIATSGRHGRSLSMGIADSVTVLATSAAQADVAATLIANAVDLPDHPSVTRRLASDIDDQSDLGARSVVTGCGLLRADDRNLALQAGLALARSYQNRGLIRGAALFLQGQNVVTEGPMTVLHQRKTEYA